MSVSRGKVVIGEAPESDSEDELNVSDGVAVPAPVKGKVIAGEAPESDEDTVGKSGSMDSISSALSASSITLPSASKSTSHVSLLSKKLRERNVSLAKNIREYTEQVVGGANLELQTTDHRILDCQMKLQDAETQLRMINNNVQSIQSKLEDLLSASYIPNINIPS